MSAAEPMTIEERMRLVYWSVRIRIAAAAVRKPGWLAAQRKLLPPPKRSAAE